MTEKKVIVRKSIDELEKYHLEQLKKIKEKKEKEKLKKLEPITNILKKHINKLNDEKLESIKSYILEEIND